MWKNYLLKKVFNRLLKKYKKYVSMKYQRSNKISFTVIIFGRKVEWPRIHTISRPIDIFMFDARNLISRGEVLDAIDNRAPVFQTRAITHEIDKINAYQLPSPFGVLCAVSIHRVLLHNLIRLYGKGWQFVSKESTDAGIAKGEFDRRCQFRRVEEHCLFFLFMEEPCYFLFFSELRWIGDDIFCYWMNYSFPWQKGFENVIISEVIFLLYYRKQEKLKIF